MDICRKKYAKIEVKGIGICKLNLRDGWTLFLYDVLYAPEIWQNLISIIVLLGLGFNLSFQGNGLDLYSEDLFYSVGYFLDGFIMLNFEQHDIFGNSCFCLHAFSSNNVVVVIIWHTRIGHICQDWMNRLAKKDLLGSILKIDLPICEHY